MICSARVSIRPLAFQISGLWLFSLPRPLAFASSFFAQMASDDEDVELTTLYGKKKVLRRSPPLASRDETASGPTADLQPDVVMEDTATSAPATSAKMSEATETVGTALPKIPCEKRGST